MADEKKEQADRATEAPKLNGRPRNENSKRENVPIPPYRSSTSEMTEDEMQELLEFDTDGMDDDLLFDDEDELTLSDLIGSLDKVPEGLQKRMKAWGDRWKSQLSKLHGYREQMKNLHNNIKKRGKAVRKLLNDRSKTAARRLITGDQNKKVRDYVKEPPVVRMIDCVSFTLGVILLASAEFMALRHPHYFYIFYVITSWAMILTRVLLWWGGSFKYFLFDFCYYVNGVTSIALLLNPQNAALLQVCFVWANGPVSLAMVTWRNSLVFHSLEKVTSLYVHAAPPLAMMCIRWYTKTISPACETPECKLTMWNWWGLSFGGYLLWQALQLFLTEVIGREEIQSKGLQTSCRWIATHPRMPVHFLSLKITRFLGIMGKDEQYDHTTWKTKVIFVTFQAAYTLITMLPCKILFESFWAHFTYLIVLYIYCVWNGARYYVHVFAERYVLQFREAPRTGDSLIPPPAMKTSYGTKKGN